MAAILVARFTTPLPNVEVEENIFVSGYLDLNNQDSEENTTFDISSVHSVMITFGTGGPSVAATMTGNRQWQCSATVNPGNTPIGQPLILTVDAHVTVRAVFAGIPAEGVPARVSYYNSSDHSSVGVFFKQLPPELSVVFKSPVDTTTLPYAFELSGTASNGQSGITAVRFSIDNRPFENVDNPNGNWSSWSKTINLPTGSFPLTVEAVGGPPRQLKTTFASTVVIRTPFEPAAIDQVFANTTYLRELLAFTTRQIRIGTAIGPSPVALADRFFQAYDKLTAAKAFEQATQPLLQPRIAIEVLRRYLQSVPPPAELDHKFRFIAYQNLLRELGASYEELRLARVAEQSTRIALAARLGFDLEANRPDHLDDITLVPDAITDAQLEELFGYRATLPVDPLQASTLNPQLPVWQFATLRSVWLREDTRNRDAAEGALPIIDPDIIAKDHIKLQTATNPAYALWTARQAWITAKLAEIEQEGATLPTPLARFDQVLGKFIGSIDLPNLANRDARGEDLSLELRLLNLDTAAFRFLVRSRALLVAGTLLQSEWQDVFAIVLQAQKRARFRQWRTEEKQASLTLEPGVFLANSTEPAEEIPRWRGTMQTFSQWRRSLQARSTQKLALETGYQVTVAAAEAQTLPGLRDALLEVICQRQAPIETIATTAERLTRKLLIDFRANDDAKTTRVDQALETLQGVLFSVRSGRLAAGADGVVWTVNELNFDAEWTWIGSYRTWLAAMRVFAYPENQLFPNLYVTDRTLLTPTQAFIGAEGLIVKLRKEARLTPAKARKLAGEYLDKLRAEVPAANTGLPANFVLTDLQMSADELNRRRDKINELFSNITDPNAIPPYLREVFWLVPMALALRLQNEREYLVALDWYQTVYAFDLPLAERKRYPGLRMEESITSSYSRTTKWLVEDLNPHIVARTSTENQVLVGRKNVYTRFTVMSIVRCFQAYADLEFSRNVAESVARARTLYETAIDLLDLNDVRPETGPTIPFPANPVWQSLKLHAEANLAKIHNGLNIAGIRAAMPLASGTPTIFLPSQYRYAFLVERAKNLVGIAQQMESAFLTAVIQHDAEAYSRFQANHDIRVAGTSISLADLKVADADILGQEAQLQKEKADVQFDHFDGLISEGVNIYERLALKALEGAALAKGAAAVISFKLTENPWATRANAIGDFLAATSQALQTRSSFERREEEWRLQKNLAEKDQQIGQQQILHAQNQQQVAVQERELAGLQLAHASAVLDFLANKFTSAELFEWMSGVLSSVYAYFLQQATALAQLAEAQLAFERQEAAPGFVRADYWQDAADSAAATPVDRRGLTGSARLLQDIYRLDQYAFETDRRKLHLTQTLSIAQIAAMELQRFRETGVLVFATPEAMFDQEFPGHYLRLIKRVKVSLIALVPPIRGVRASLTASGLSRVIVAGDEFSPVILSRSPESIVFTSPLNATGMFELESENGMLLPFEGMGLDAVWQLELPKPANPFDYRTIADVLLTVEYTALSSYDYRQRVLRNLDRSFSGDRAFSLRDQFSDAWYELNNPDQVEASRQMRVTLPFRRDDFPPHIESLTVEQVLFFCIRKDGFVQELRIVSLAHAIDGLDTVTATEVQTWRHHQHPPTRWRALAGVNRQKSCGQLVDTT
ncbi:MAG: hypothetical protein HOO92_03580 [Methylococcaceae bacterium]|nr:hypothetical protein [Methylococcaceae bacterium]